MAHASPGIRYEMPKLVEMRRTLAQYRTSEKNLHTKRHHLLEELVNTERHYVKMLCDCAEHYEAPLLESNAFNPALVQVIFSGLVELRDHHLKWSALLEALWDNLNAQLEANLVSSCDHFACAAELPLGPFIDLLGKGLVAAPAFMYSYTRWFATPVADRLAPLHELCKKDKAVDELFEAIRCRAGKNLEFYLRLPLRALPRYSLLLIELIKEAEGSGRHSKSESDEPGLQQQQVELAQAVADARHLEASIKQKQSEMADMGQGVAAARREVPLQVEVTVHRAMGMRLMNGSSNPSKTSPKVVRKPPFVVEVRVVSEVDGTSSVRKSEKIKTAASRSNGSGGCDPYWGSSAEHGEKKVISAALHSTDASRIVCKVFDRAQTEVGRAELWLDMLLPTRRWQGWLALTDSHAGGAGLGSLHIAALLCPRPPSSKLSAAEAKEASKNAQRLERFSAWAQRVAASDGSATVEQQTLATSGVGARPAGGNGGSTGGHDSAAIQQEARRGVAQRQSSDAIRAMTHLETKLAYVEQALRQRRRSINFAQQQQQQAMPQQQQGESEAVSSRTDTNRRLAALEEEEAREAEAVDKLTLEVAEARTIEHETEQRLLAQEAECERLRDEVAIEREEVERSHAREAALRHKAEQLAQLAAAHARADAEAAAAAEEEVHVRQHGSAAAPGRPGSAHSLLQGLERSIGLVETSAAEAAVSCTTCTTTIHSRTSEPAHRALADRCCSVTWPCICACAYALPGCNVVYGMCGRGCG